MNLAKHIVSLLGRDQIMASLGVKTQSVSEAIGKGKFPARWYLGISALLEDAGHAEPDMDAFIWRPFAAPSAVAA
jgi:hypothetical protein